MKKLNVHNFKINHQSIRHEHQVLKFIKDILREKGEKNLYNFIDSYEFE